MGLDIEVEDCSNFLHVKNPYKLDFKRIEMLTKGSTINTQS